MTKLRRLKYWEIVLANTIFLVHSVVFAGVFFGWLMPSFWKWYLALLVVVLISDIYLGYCFLSKWEFALRKFANPKLRYDYSFTFYYTRKLTGSALPKTFIEWTGFIFLISMIVIILYFNVFVSLQY